MAELLVKAKTAVASVRAAMDWMRIRFSKLGGKSRAANCWCRLKQCKQIAAASLPVRKNSRHVINRRSRRLD
jgi:hypothetical protein